jgi:uncharacterized protein
MWDDICTGALGAVVLVDTRRIDQCFPGIDYFEAKQIPFVVGVNNFDGAERYGLAEVRDALGIDEHVPVVDCDARAKDSVKTALITLLESLVAQARAKEGLA